MENLYTELLNDGFGMTCYYPLCSGILTGKYNSGNFPENSRAKDSLGGTTSCFKTFLGA